MDSNLMILATSKAIKTAAESQARDRILPRTHEVDFWVHISGTVKIGEPFEKTPTCSIPYKKAFAALAAIAGCTREAGLDKIRQAMTIALQTESDAGLELAEFFPKMEEMERDLVQPMLAELPKMTCKGVITTKLTVDFTPATAMVAVA